MSDDVAIKVDSVSKTFKLPHEKNTSIKSAVINFYRRKRTFEKQQVLQDISFEIKKGEFFGIVGRNGSGKSTLLKMLAGIYSPTSGNILVNGKLTPFIELGVGFNPELTGRENTFLNGALLGFNRKEMEQMYDDIVAFSEIQRFMDQKLKNYSSGMQVRLAFSIAIQAKSDILLIDEVLAVGDISFQQKSLKYFNELKSQGQTVIFISHDMAAVREFCDRALLIDDGKIIKQGDVVDVANLYVLQNLKNDQKEAPDQNNRKSFADITSLHLAVDHKKDKYQPSDELTCIVSFELKTNRDVYVGFSLIKNNQSIAEMNSKHIKINQHPGQKKIKLVVPLERLLDGIHHFDISILDRETGELLSQKIKAEHFYIAETTKIHRGAFRIDARWEELS